MIPVEFSPFPAEWPPALAVTRRSVGTVLEAPPREEAESRLR